MSDDNITPSSTPVAQLFAKLEVDKGSTSQIFPLDPSMFSPPEKTKEKKQIIPPTTMKGLTINHLWNEVFGNNIAFLTEYHESRKEKDLVSTKWEFSPDHSSGFRTMSMQTVVEVPRKGTYTLLNEAHRFAFSIEGGKPRLVVHISAQTPNVPLGGSFRVETLIEVTADSLDGDCTLELFANTKKVTFAFGPISYIATPRAIKETREGYIGLLKLIGSSLCKQPVALPAAPAMESSETFKEAPVATASTAEPSNCTGAVPSWSLYVLVVLAVATVALLLSSTFVVSNSTDSLRRLTKAVAQNQFRSASGSKGGNSVAGGRKSSTWDSLDEDLLKTTSNAEIDNAESGDGSVGSAALLNRHQLIILARHEANSMRLAEMVDELASRVTAMEDTVSRQWWLGFICAFGVVVLAIKAFVV